MEAIVGAFHSEEGPPEPAYVERADGSFLIAGWMPLDACADLLSIAVPPHRGYHTVAGLVLQHFGALPEVGNAFDLDGWRIEVVDLDGRRIDKILATKKSGDARASAA
jgi:putative hemolysin